MRIYYAGPMFSRAELDFNAGVVKELRDKGFEVFLPQENPIPDLAQGTDEGKRRSMYEIFASDIAAIDSSDILLISMDGRVPDEGACFELGYAYARGKICVGLKTDIRVSEFGMDNAMLVGSLGDNIANDVQSLVTMLSGMEAIMRL